MKIFRIKLLYFLLFIVISLGGIGLWLGVNTDYARSLVLRLWQYELNKRLGVTLEVKSLTGNPLTSIFISDVKLIREGYVFFTVAEVELSYNFLAFLGGRFRLGRLVLLRPKINIDSSFLFSDVKASFSRISLALTINNFEIRQGIIYIENDFFGVKCAEKVDLLGSIVLDSRSLIIDINLHHSLVYSVKINKPFIIGGKFFLHNYYICFSKISIICDSNWLHLNGDLNWHRENFKNFYLNLVCKGELSDITIFSWSWMKSILYLSDSSVNLLFTIKGPLEQLRLNGYLEYNPFSRVEIQGDLNLIIPKVQIRLGFSKLDISSIFSFIPVSLKVDGISFVSVEGISDYSSYKVCLKLISSLSLETFTGKVSGANSLIEVFLEGNILKISSFIIEAPWGVLEIFGQVFWPVNNYLPKIDAVLNFRNLTFPFFLFERMYSWLYRFYFDGVFHINGDFNNLIFWGGGKSFFNNIELANLQILGKVVDKYYQIKFLEIAIEDINLIMYGEVSPLEIRLTYDVQVRDLGKIRILSIFLGEVLSTLFMSEKFFGVLHMRGTFDGLWRSPFFSLKVFIKKFRGYNLAFIEAFFKIDKIGLNLCDVSKLRLYIYNLKYTDYYFERLILEIASSSIIGNFLEFNLWGPDVRIVFQINSSTISHLPCLFFLDKMNINIGKNFFLHQLDRAIISLDFIKLTLQGLILVQGDQQIILDIEFNRNFGVDVILGINRLSLISYMFSRQDFLKEINLEAFICLQGSILLPNLKIQGVVSSLNCFKDIPFCEIRFTGDFFDNILYLFAQALNNDILFLDFIAELKNDYLFSFFTLCVNQFELKARGQIELISLNLLEYLIPDISEVSGQIKAEVNISGKLNSLQFLGDVIVYDGAFIFNANNQNIYDIEGRFFFQGRKVIVERITAVSSGTVKIDGVIIFPWVDDGLINLNLVGREFKVSLTALGEIFININFKVDGTVKYPIITGCLYPVKGVIRPHLTPPLSLAEVVILRSDDIAKPIYCQQSKAPIFILSGLGRNVTIDIMLVFVPDLHLIVDEGFLKLSGLISIRKDSSNLITFHNQIRVTNGILVIKGRRVEIKEGLIDFKDKTVIDPELIVKGSINEGMFFILVNLTGSVSDFQINFSSEPPMNQADILSTIIFNRPVRMLSSDESYQLSGQALALLGQRGRQEITKFLEPFFIPDIVTIYTALQTGSSLEAGKYLTSDFYLRYRRNLAPEGGQSIGLEYKVNSFISLETQIGSARDSGIDVVLSLDFN